MLNQNEFDTDLELMNRVILFLTEVLQNISAVKRLIAINRIQNKSLCLHMCVYCVFLLCIYKDTYSIYFENIYMYVHVYI